MCLLNPAAMQHCLLIGKLVSGRKHRAGKIDGKYKTQDVACGILHGSAVVLQLFDVFVNSLDNRIASHISSFNSNTEIGSIVSNPDGSTHYKMLTNVRNEWAELW